MYCTRSGWHPVSTGLMGWKPTIFLVQCTTFNFLYHVVNSNCRGYIASSLWLITLEGSKGHRLRRHLEEVMAYLKVQSKYFLGKTEVSQKLPDILNHVLKMAINLMMCCGPNLFIVIQLLKHYHFQHQISLWIGDQILKQCSHCNCMSLSMVFLMSQNRKRETLVKTQPIYHAEV